MSRTDRISRGTQKPSRGSAGVPPCERKKALTPQEQALCIAVVDLLLDRHRERKGASDSMPRASDRRDAKPSKMEAET